MLFKSSLIPILASLVIFACVVQVHSGYVGIRATLRHKTTNQLVTVDNNGILKLKSTNLAALSETFELIKNTDGTVSLKSSSTNLFVSYVPNWTIPNILVAKSATISDTEKFVLMANGDGFSIRTISSGRPVFVQNSYLLANQNSGLVEAFYINFLQINLKFKLNNRYVTAENGGNSSLIANRLVASVWETFQLILNSDLTVSIKALANKLYVTSPSELILVALIASRDVISKTEKFTIHMNSDGTISFLANNNRFVCGATVGLGDLYAFSQVIDEYDSFYVGYA